LERRRAETSGDMHHIFVNQPHDPNCAMVVRGEGKTFVIALDKPAHEPAGNKPMYPGNQYSLSLTGRGTSLSDSVAGMHMPQRQHECYYATYVLDRKTDS